MHRMTPFDPAKFRLGDIVEVQLSFMAIPVRQKHRVRIILRSLALISNQHSKVWLIYMQFMMY